MRSINTTFLTFLSTLLLVSCSDTDIDRGRLSISLTDAPVTADKVVFHFTGATIQPENGDLIEVVITDPNDSQSIGRSVDLLEYTDGTSTELFNELLPIGGYSQIRLDVDFDPAKTYLQTPDGGQHELICTGCDNDGLTIENSLTISVALTSYFTLDFELNQSITESSGEYILRPSIRMIDSLTDGQITGTADTALTDTIGGPDGCMAYVFEGSDIIPNDIYIPETGDVPEDHNNPLSTASVDATTGVYSASFLPAGDYTISLTCDSELDDAAAEDTLDFTGTVNITVLSGGISIVDFTTQ